ncbi:MAG: hypothetical protein SAJ12_14560 [Jaaginema sp. PMC 1079.18]|nr:hypothetical protein [Jaaginema sp. PMC 1080.18]MEC4852206.1 hypothetical protein [Jaaginema sp. PMC 1079.18]MEC4865325.1 hypothetical protein [Jaaginema sp. PMC 1078.18]
MDGRSIAETLELPVRQRRILNIVRRQQECSFAQIVRELREDEQTVLYDLDLLVSQDFLQDFYIAGEAHYRLNFSPEESRNPANIKQVLTPGKPLAIITNPSGEQSLQAGSEPFKLSVTVTNQGNESALINVYIDQNCPLIQQACYLPPTPQRLALTPGQSSEVEFEIPIQMNASPGLYNYLLVVDAPNHYPEDTPIQLLNQLRITPFIQAASTDSDPSFIIRPLTNSEQRILVAPGEFLELNVEVLNRGKRVDRFRLTCPDLDPNWYKVIYPEGLAVPGIIVTAEALELNPGQTGEITLQLLIPPDALSQVYTPTIRLFSDNYPDLALLDIFYFEVAPIYLLDARVLTLISRVKDTPGKYQLHFYNPGNIARNLRLNLISIDEEQVYRHDLEPQQIYLPPGTQQTVDLKVYPPKSGWRRPFYGRIFNFAIEIEDLDQFPLVIERLQGTLTWEGRPWWHLLLFILAGLGLTGAIAFLIWWLLFRPKPTPEIITFSPESPSYQAFNNDFVRLQWQVSQPHKIQSINIVGLSPDGHIISEPRTFDVSQGIPREISQFCRKDDLLICDNVPTDARQAGDYIFELTLVTQQGDKVVSQTMQTKTVRIEPIPLPKIASFEATQAVYQEASLTSANTSATDTPKPGILLNWQIDDIRQVQALTFVGRNAEGIANTPEQNFSLAENIPESLAPFCQIQVQTLICRGVPTYVTNAGTYTFELIVNPQQNSDPENAIAQTTEPIKIAAIPSVITEFKIQGNQAQPKYQIPIDPNEPIFLVLEWEVTGNPQTKVELLPSPGTVPLIGSVAYPISQTPKSETITLQVTNPEGEQISRSVTIETIAPPITAIAANEAEMAANQDGTGESMSPGTIPTLPPLEPGEMGSGSLIPPPPNGMMSGDNSGATNEENGEPAPPLILPPILPNGTFLPPAELPPQSD